MNSRPSSHRTPGGDPLLAALVASGRTPLSQPDSDAPGSAATSRGGSRPPRRHHPARGARALALAASVVATGAVAATLAYSEGALSADSDAAVSGSTEQVASTTPTVNSSAAVTTIAADANTATTTPTPTTATTSATTTPETTPPTTLTVGPSGFADGVYLGSAEYTEWGDVQVQVTISDGGIVNVAAVEYPSSRKSSAINGQAIPMLEADAIAMQSADLDIVSGATYTSRTYADSMQAALDQAALATIQTAETQVSS